MIIELVKIREFLGFDIYYNPNTKLFEAFLDAESVFTAGNEKELEERIKGYRKPKEGIPVIVRVGDSVYLGKATSLFEKPVAYNPDRCRVVLEGERGWQEFALIHIYEKTEERMTLVSQILDLKNQEKELFKKRTDLMQKLGTSLSKERVLELFRGEQGEANIEGGQA